MAATFTKEDVGRAIESWRADPLPFIRDVLHADMWGSDVPGKETGQCLIARSVAQHTQTSVVSCNAIGKDYSAAQITLWWLAIWEEAAVITLAPSAHQVKDLTWRDIHKAYHQSAIPFGGQLNQTSLQIDDRRFATGLSTDKKERVMGIHNPHLLVIVTEASGMDENVMEGIETLGAGGDAHILLLGNPTADQGTFYRSHHDLADLYKTIHIGYLDTPNFQPGEKERPYLVNPTWVEGRRRKWGDQSPLWEIHVEGRFPKQDPDSLIPYQVAFKAQKAWQEEAMRPSALTVASKKMPLIVGMDISRQGDSETVVCRRRGLIPSPFDIYEGPMMTTEARDIAIKIIKEENPNRFYVDATGIGGAVVDELDELGYHMVEPIYTGARASDASRFENMRAELWWKLRTWLQLEGGMLPEDDLLLTQVSAPKYGYSRRQLVKIESKDDLRSRGFKSPDRADALVLTLVDELDKELMSAVGAEIKGFTI